MGRTTTNKSTEKGVSKFSKKMSDGDYQFESVGGAGASLTYPMEAGQLRKGGHAMLKGHPCKVVELSISKTGKHGHAKCAIVGIDIFTNKKYEDMCPSTHNMEVPNLVRTEFQLLDLDAETGTVSVLLENGDTKDDLNLPRDTQGSYEEHAETIIKQFDEGKGILVTVLKSMDQEKIVAYKEMAA